MPGLGQVGGGPGGFNLPPSLSSLDRFQHRDGRDSGCVTQSRSPHSGPHWVTGRKRCPRGPDQPESSGLWEVFAGSQSHAGSREPSMVCRPLCRGRRQAGWGNPEEAGDPAALGRMGSLAMGYCQLNVQGPKKNCNC